MIREGVYHHPGPPPITARERAVADCGCMVITGVRSDRAEPAMAVVPCEAKHRAAMRDVQRALARRLNAGERMSIAGDYGKTRLADAADEELTKRMVR